MNEKSFTDYINEVLSKYDEIIKADVSTKQTQFECENALTQIKALHKEVLIFHKNLKTHEAELKALKKELKALKLELEQSLSKDQTNEIL